MTGSSKAAIAELLSEARQRTLALIEPLDDEQLNRVYSPILSPLAWDLGHIANFEELWLVQTIGGREPMRGDLGRFYDAIENPRKTRGELPILRDAELRAYMADVRKRTLDVLEGGDRAEADDPLLRDGFVYEMLLAHELQHNETMLQLLQMVDGYGRRELERHPGPRLATPRWSRDGSGRRSASNMAARMSTASPMTTSAAATPSSSTPSRSIAPPSPTCAYLAFMGGDRGRAADVLGARRRGRLGRRGDGLARAPRPGQPGGPRLLASGRRLCPVGPESGCRPSRSGRRPAPVPTTTLPT